MVINSRDAKQFIAGYTALLTQVHLLTGGKQGEMALLAMLAMSRKKIAMDPPLAEVAIQTLEDLGKPLDEEVLEAVRTLVVKGWIYLRDTPEYSIFLDPDGEEAYAVLGLTDRISKIIGGSGMVLEIGLIRYKGKYVCDGLITNVAVLGDGYRKSFSDRLKELKQSGHFHLE